MRPTSIYPVIATKEIARTVDFYVQHFGFTVTFEADWYVSMRHRTAPHYELAVLDYTHASVPKTGRHAVAGLLLNVEVDDVDAEYERLIDGANLPILKDIRSEVWGQRHFITADPNGVMIDVITNIPPSEEYTVHYATTDM